MSLSHRGVGVLVEPDDRLGHLVEDFDPGLEDAGRDAAQAVEGAEHHPLPARESVRGRGGGHGRRSPLSPPTLTVHRGLGGGVRGRGGERKRKGEREDAAQE